MAACPVRNIVRCGCRVPMRWSSRGSRAAKSVEHGSRQHDGKWQSAFAFNQEIAPATHLTAFAFHSCGSWSGFDYERNIDEAGRRRRADGISIDCGGRRVWSDLPKLMEARTPTCRRDTALGSWYNEAST
jgi:hypothetical protein